MTKILSILFLLFSVTSFAGLTPKREALYKCVNFDEQSAVDGAFIYSSRFGRNKFYEIEVHYTEDFKEKTIFKKVNLVSKYEGRIQEYTTGNFRIKIDRVNRDVDNHFKAFARIPDFKVHSKMWSCKDIYGL